MLKKLFTSRPTGFTVKGAVSCGAVCRSLCFGAKPPYSIEFSYELSFVH